LSESHSNGQGAGRNFLDTIAGCGDKSGQRIALLMSVFNALNQSYWLFALVSFACLTSRAADDFSSLQTATAPLGRLIITPFLSAPFPHPARSGGHYYHGQLFSATAHYSDPNVALFVPKDFHPGNTVDFVVHFHGWNHALVGTLPEYHLIEQFAAAGRNAILVVPQGPYNAPDSFDGKLEDTNGFKVFMNEVLEKLAANGVFASHSVVLGNVILSGHSGGYHPIGAIVDHGGLTGHIREVWLFDALYGNIDNFVDWQKNENGRLINIYTDHGGTRENSEALLAMYRTKGVALFANEDTNTLPDNLLTNKLVFMHTDMAHNEVPRKRLAFELFLKTSLLHAQ
jgi:hypothetical protein